VAATQQAGSAERWGDLWSARAQDWAAIEEQQLPTYREAMRRVGVEAGQRILEVACGSGVFLSEVVRHGAHAVGIDASAGLLDLARIRVPSGELHQADMQSLPFRDATFDLVAGFNAFFFADDMVAALREAGRVAKPGAPVVIQVWGDPDRCSLEAMKAAVFGERDQAPPLWRPGALEDLAHAAGLTPDESFDLTWAYTFDDEAAMVRGMCSAAPIAAAAQQAGDGSVEHAVSLSLAPYRTPSGGYELPNAWHFLIATR
jgi:SAM-dependent methyltransferase